VAGVSLHLYPEPVSSFVFELFYWVLADPVRCSDKSITCNLLLFFGHKFNIIPHQSLRSYYINTDLLRPLLFLMQRWKLLLSFGRCSDLFYVIDKSLVLTTAARDNRVVHLIYRRSHIVSKMNEPHTWGCCTHTVAGDRLAYVRLVIYKDKTSSSRLLSSEDELRCFCCRRRRWVVSLFICRSKHYPSFTAYSIRSTAVGKCSVHSMRHRSAAAAAAIHIYTVSQKGATKLMAVTSSNLNRFSKFFYQWKRRKFPIKFVHYFPPHRKYTAALNVGI